MPRCAWEFVPRSGSMAGSEICTLTGRPCIIDAPRERPNCTRAAMIKAWQAKHYPGEPHRAIEEAAR
jgi:hypothetical protein